MSSALGDHLKSRRRYEDQIERLHNRHLLSKRMYTLEQEGVPLATLVQARSRLARILAASVAEGWYQSQPAVIREILTEGRGRRVFSYRLTDVIVHATIAGILQDALEPRLSSRVFSYRKGMSRWAAVTDFAAYLRSHRRSNSDPRRRGVYVLRRDVASYADSIPMTATSRLWSMVRENLAAAPPTSILPEHWTLIERAVRPEIFADGHRARASMVSGVATGQPIACVLFNMYLGDLDRALEGVPDSFYARYSDDILFAHPDPDVARSAARTMADVLHALGLRFKEIKACDRFLTRPGRPSPAWPEAKGTSAITFLGTRISADGAISIKQESVRTLLAELETRTRTAAGALEHADLDQTGRLVCAVVNQVLDPYAGPESWRETAALLERVVTDRKQLAQLDYSLARLVLRVVTGDAGVRAFRRVPYRKVRQEWGLRSLLHARNGWKPHAA